MPRRRTLERNQISCACAAMKKQRRSTSVWRRGKNERKPQGEGSRSVVLAKQSSSSDFNSEIVRTQISTYHGHCQGHAETRSCEISTTHRNLTAKIYPKTKTIDSLTPRSTTTGTANLALHDLNTVMTLFPYAPPSLLTGTQHCQEHSLPKWFNGEMFT